MDQKSKTAGQPFFVKNDAIAIRSFSAAVEEGNSDLSKYPEDFVLLRIGEFNQETGEITGTSHELVAQAHDFKKSTQDQVK